jgi:hypothetical protein
MAGRFGGKTWECGIRGLASFHRAFPAGFLYWRMLARWVVGAVDMPPMVRSVFVTTTLGCVFPQYGGLQRIPAGYV